MNTFGTFWGSPKRHQGVRTAVPPNQRLLLPVRGRRVVNTSRPRPAARSRSADRWADDIEHAR
jgi:hypothetical protein